ncbi:MAG: MBL fold metallo-hydrolase [Dehalococcoidales bacterium]|nr:MBL fold metallo-hydrolase [Dehalococcoidales bacterium]
MNRKRLIIALLILVVVAVGGAAGRMLWPDSSPALAQTQSGAPTLQWLGWSHFKIVSADGTVILINPWVTNPDSPVTLDDVNEADYILVPNGHGDELGETIEIAQKTGAKVITGGFELGSWLMEKGVPQEQVIRSNPGNWHQLGNITVRVVNSVHGSGLPAPTAQNPYGGPAAGFFITLETGYTIYFAGSTAATMDMQLWGSTFKPDLAILPLNSGRDPVDVAQMVRLLSIDNPNLKRVIAHHQRAVPGEGHTTIAQMESAIRSLAGSPVAVIRLQPGQTIQLGK